ILEYGGVEIRPTSGGAPHAGMSRAGIQRSPLNTREECVRFRDLLKLVFRLRIIRIAVRMIRHRQLAVSALDFNLGGRAGDTEDFVKIAFCVSGQKLPPLFSSCN